MPETHVTTNQNPLETISRLTDAMENAISPADIEAVITDPHINAALLRQCAVTLIKNTYWSHAEKTRATYFILASPACTEELVIEVDSLSNLANDALRVALSKDLPLSEPAMMHATIDRWRQRDVEYRMTVMKHQSVNEAVIAHYARDWRVTISRAVAKHHLLNAETGKHLLESNDPQTRANVVRQPWVERESLYLLANDRNANVRKAAKKALAERGLPETDEIDAVMDDEVSLFFLTASEDEDTIVRLGSSLNTPEDTLRTIAGLSWKGKMAVAGNSAAPSDLLEDLSLEVIEADRWNSEIAAVLAANPNNTGAGLEALVQAARWDRETILAALRNPNCTPFIARDRGTHYAARNRAAAIKTGFLEREQMDYIMRTEYRDGVLRAVVEWDGSTADDLRTCYQRGGTKVREKAEARLAEMGEPLTVEG